MEVTRGYVCVFLVAEGRRSGWSIQLREKLRRRKGDLEPDCQRLCKKLIMYVTVFERNISRDQQRSSRQNAPGTWSIFPCRDVGGARFQTVPVRFLLLVPCVPVKVFMDGAKAPGWDRPHCQFIFKMSQIPLAK